jgi:threonine dehydrogenase-like Zn-dependent dehydrogenase
LRVTIFGTGYVGLVTGTCLAEVGHDVVCVDIDAAKVDGLNHGVIPIYEPGLEPMVNANRAAGRLHFTTDAAAGITHGDVIFIAVGTPPDEDGSADLKYVLAVARISNVRRWSSTSPRFRSAPQTRSARRLPRRWPHATPMSRSMWSPTPSSSRKVRRSRTACALTGS